MGGKNEASNNTAFNRAPSSAGGNRVSDLEDNGGFQFPQYRQRPLNNTNGAFMNMNRANNGNVDDDTDLSSATSNDL